jgi:KDO2-lipid IV(A) lauroyltransferase
MRPGMPAQAGATEDQHREVTVDKVADTLTQRKPFRHLLAAPWFYNLGFAAARRIPLSFLYGVADFLGMATYLTCGALVRTVRANLVRAFPHASEREISRLTRKIFRNFARYLVDYGRFRWAPQDGFETVIPVLEGGENLQDAFDAGRGVILVTGHIGNWELGGLFFGHRGLKVNVVTLPDGSHQIDAIRKMYRGQYSINTIVLDGSPFASLEMVAALKRGEMVAMLVDRWGKADGVPSAFLGGVHYLPRGPFVLSRATGAPILPAFVVRDGISYRGIIEPSFVVVQDDLGPYAIRISQALERLIRRYPDQWYNFVAM